MNRSFLWTQVAIAAGALLLLAGHASAAEKLRVGLGKFEGPSANKAEAAVKAALSSRPEVELVTSKALSKADGAEISSLAQKLDLDAVVMGITAKGKKGAVELKVGVHAPDGSVTGRSAWKLKKPNDTKPLQASFWPTLGKAVKKASRAQPKDDGEVPEVASGHKPKIIDVPQNDDTTEKRKPIDASTETGRTRFSSNDEASESSHSADSSEDGVSTRIDSEGTSEYGDLDAEVGIKAFTRSFTYNQPLAGNLASYKLTSGPAVAGAAEWYVGSLAKDSAASNLGAALMAESAFGIGSAAQDGARVGTSAYAFDLGARYRYLINDSAKVWGGVGYGTRVFSIANTPDTVLSMVPDVAYKYVSVRAGGHYSITRQLSVNASAAYLKLLGTGELQSAKFFPRETGAGVEAAAFVGYDVTPKIEVRVGVDMQRFFFSLNPKQGDANVAGGALDQYFAGTARVAYRLD